MSSDSPTTTTSLNERTAAVASSPTASAAATTTTNTATATMKATETPAALSTSTSPPRTTTAAVRLTNTNTDNLCCDKNDNIFKRYLYRFNLWTGLYMLNPYEQMVFHLVCWFSVGVSLAYFAVFASGFFEGLRRATATAAGATSTAEQEE